MTPSGADPAGATVWVVIPTYNEAANLVPIVTGALEALRSGAHSDYRVLVVDDDSPDGTGELAQELADRSEHVEVLHRPAKDGLGQAYLAGFAKALAGGAQLVLEMDADFSHDPADIPRLIAATGEADLALGSRYVAGGRVEQWGALRRFVSRGGTLYARAVLGVAVRDLTGGFKCFRRELLEALDLETVRSQGYTFQIELTHRALERGFRVVEIPIVFRDRRAGESKMSARIALEAAYLVPRIRRDGRR
ncbi:MAG TPA: polyprenol monophosphomannose synthase [Solirubrobacteraceae bacterium]|nr:polyprenol monophosphomannose synthase [Solirubrobacteraceae bacterium]